VNFSFSPPGGTIANLPGAGPPGTTDSYDTTWPTGALADGTYSVTATVADKATNSDFSNRTVIVDNTPPTASLDDPGAYGHGTIALTVTVGAVLSTVAVVEEVALFDMLSVALTLQACQIIVAASEAPEIVRLAKLRAAVDVEEALDIAYEHIGRPERASVLLVPRAIHTLPVVA